MNKLAQVIYNMEHNGGNLGLADTLSREEKHMLTELSALLGQTSERLAVWLDEGPEPTDWAVVPSVVNAN